MPYKDRDIKKLYFTIGEVAEQFSTSTSHIRFWEKEFDILQPKKNKKGNRLFSPEDIENLKIINHLVKEKGYTLQGAKDYLKGNKGIEADKQKVIESLTNLKSFLLKLNEELGG